MKLRPSFIGANVPEIPEMLLDPDELSKNIYDYWISLLRTDKAVDEEAATWDNLDDAFKEDFTEAVRVQVTDVLKPYLEEIQLDERIDRAFKDSGGGYTCYVCDRAAVSNPGDLCGQCASTHLSSWKNQ